MSLQSLHSKLGTVTTRFLALFINYCPYWSIGMWEAQSQERLEVFPQCLSQCKELQVTYFLSLSLPIQKRYRIFLDTSECTIVKCIIPQEGDVRDLPKAAMQVTDNGISWVTVCCQCYFRQLWHTIQSCTARKIREERKVLPINSIFWNQCKPLLKDPCCLDS